jgi:hypothetical protein
MKNAVFWDIKTQFVLHRRHITSPLQSPESSRLILCKIGGFHGSDYEDCRLLGGYARMALVRNDVSEELSASIIRVTRIGELGTTLAVTSNQRTLRRNTKLRLTLFLVQ